MLTEGVNQLTNLADMVSQMCCWEAITGLCVILILVANFSNSTYPLVNGKRLFEIQATPARKRFLVDAWNLFRSGFEQAPIFRILTDNGYKTMLSPKYANEIKSLGSLSFGRAISKEFHTHISGFEPFRQGTTDDQIFQDAIRMKLTQSLGSLTEPLSTETALVFQQYWTDSPDWHELTVKPSMLQIVAQLSSRVFLGEEVCRDPDWLRLTVNYTVHSFMAAELLRLWPWILRPVVAYFLPACRATREDLREARKIIGPVLEKRRSEKESARKLGKEAPKYSDAMEWMEQCAKGRPYDAATAQLSFSFAAIHTTADLLTQVLYDIAGKEDLIQALRDEVITVFKEEGWKKSMLYKLKLMDSMIKESQRLKPTSIASMRRLATSDVTLSDGNKIPKGSSVIVSSDLMWDPSVYSDPETFDAYRFLKLRDIPGHETSSQLVSPSPEHMGFGLGKHACPGRFFAANEAKVFLSHLLLKYDIKPVKGSPTKPRRLGISLSSNSMGQIAIRRRKEEVAL